MAAKQGVDCARTPGTEVGEEGDSSAALNKDEWAAAMVAHAGVDWRTALRCADAAWARQERHQRQRQSLAVPNESERDRVGLVAFFRLMEAEACLDAAPTFEQLLVTFMAACNLAGATFAAGSTRQLALRCHVSHETFNRRLIRLSDKLRGIHRDSAHVPAMRCDVMEREERMAA